MALLINLYTLGLMMYSATELKRATNNFSKENLIGKGGFGEVYSAELRCSSVAVKILKKVYWS